MRRVAVLAVGFLVAFTGVALAVANGRYAGSTSQKGSHTTDSRGHYLFTLTVKSGKVSSGTYSANYTGGSHCAFHGFPTQWGKHAKPTKIKNGKFSGTETVGTGGNDHVTISGKFTGRNVSGSFDETFTSKGQKCTTGKVTYTARL